ncbi:biotin transporter BioY [Alloscardovia omnicolens]|uniref:biotin transporter BioY n=1 Tax=Alloscardovia omnicolens TaxID=419015 RepID=UPI003A73CCFA
MFTSSNLYAYILKSFKNFSVTKYLLFTLLFIASGLAGKVSIPGTQVGITMQTFVLMLLALNLTQAEGLSVVASYIAVGAFGMPVFSGGMSTAALLGPSSGFIWGFLPAFAISQALITLTRRATSSTPLRAVAYFAALVVGCMIFLYSVGVTMQSAITGMSWTALMSASFGFITFDIVKAVVAVALSLGITSASAVFARKNN